MLSRYQGQGLTLSVAGDGGQAGRIPQDHGPPRESHVVAVLSNFASFLKIKDGLFVF